MSKFNTHPSLYSHRKYSVLTPECQRTFFEIGQSLRSGKLSKEQVYAVRQTYADLSPFCISRAADEIRDIANLEKRFNTHQGHIIVLSRFGSLLNKRPRLSSISSIIPESGWIFIFHGDGFLRQSGLKSLASAPQSPFEFAAIVYRLNDWVQKVRKEAYEYAKLRFPETSSDVIAESAFFLLGQQEFLVRWDEDGKNILINELFRPDVLDSLRNEFLKIRPGKIAYILSLLLKRPDFDCHLHELAIAAELPQVRAVAFDALINNRAIWPNGYKTKWIDKVYNISKRERIYETRRILHDLDVEELLLKAVSDKSAMVRKVAASSLIALFNCPNEKMQELALQLSADKSHSVRMRADYYLKRHQIL